MTFRIFLCVATIANLAIALASTGATAQTVCKPQFSFTPPPSFDFRPGDSVWERKAFAECNEFARAPRGTTGSQPAREKPRIRFEPKGRDRVVHIMDAEYAFASLVTPDDEILVPFIDKAREMVRNGEHVLVATLVAFSSIGLEVIPDPLDADDAETCGYVRTARETVRKGGGDCEDLSILLSSLLTKMGVKSAISVMPGHTMVLVEIEPLHATVFQPYVLAWARERATVSETRVVVGIDAISLWTARDDWRVFLENGQQTMAIWGKSHWDAWITPSRVEGSPVARTSNGTHATLAQADD